MGHHRTCCLQLFLNLQDKYVTVIVSFENCKLRRRNQLGVAVIKKTSAAGGRPDRWLQLENLLLQADLI